MSADDQRGRRLLLAVGAGAAVGHVLPAATWLPQVRAATPRLGGRGRRDHVALSFDDGPAPHSTPRVLRELDALGLRATFFMLGAHAAARPELAAAVAGAGHEVAVHGWSHRYLLGQPFPLVYRRLRRAQDAITAATGTRPRWFRPPFGVLTAPALLAARWLGLQPVLWTAWGRDWAPTASPDSIMRSFGRGLQGGATLLLHDAHHASLSATAGSTVSVLPILQARCAEQGLALGPLGEHGVGAPRRTASVTPAATWTLYGSCRGR